MLTKCSRPAVNDNQEIDFEILTTTALTASADVPAGIWATNQVRRTHLVRNALTLMQYSLPLLEARLPTRQSRSLSILLRASMVSSLRGILILSLLTRFATRAQSIVLT